MFKTGLLIGKQEQHAKVLLNSLYLNGIANDLSECGTGKTYSAIAIAVAMNRPVAVVCPKSVKGKWEKLLKEHGARVEIVVNYEKLVRGNTEWLTYKPAPKGTDVPRFLLAQLHFSDNALLIFDEAHKCKAPNSLSAGAMIAAKRQGYKILILTATLATNPMEMKASGFANNLIRVPYSKEYKQFCVDHGAEWLGRWGSLVYNADDETAQSKMRMVHHSLFDVQKSASRLTRADLAEHFQKGIVDATAYTMDSLQTKKIQSVYDWLETELAKLNEHCEGYGDCILSVILQARQQIELLKVPLYVELIENSYDEGSSVVCFVNFTRTLEAIATKLKSRKEFKDTIAYVRGGQSEKARNADIADFQADKKRIMLANLAAGNAAIDLHDLNGKYSRDTIISPSFSAFHILQAMGRTDRMNALTPSYVMFAFVAGTIEERAARKVQAKLLNLNLLNDGDLNMGFSVCG